MNLVFRRASQADCESMAALINSAYRGESSGAGWTSEARILGGLRTDAENLRGLVDRVESNFLVALNAQATLVGCVHLERRAQEVCYLGMLTVLPTGQDQGVGRALLAEAEKFAREFYQSKKIEMTVITLRHELLAWYERRGYRRTGSFVSFPVHPRFGVLKVDSLEMEILDKSL
jgi:ribosomal protein S18 acetylase RimI-like enzyme